MKDIKFNKSFGQNFIFDTNLLKAIVADAKITAETEVLEIGTGAATLTKEICAKAKNVVSYEIDESLKNVINETLKNVNNVKVIFADIMKESMDSIENNFSNKYVLIANLPYYITTPIIFKFIESAKKLSAMNIMVQKEVAERICAQHNTPQYGAITVAINAIANTSISRIVKRNMFVPAPNVDSAIVSIEFEPGKFDVKNEKLLNKVIKSAFNMRRKTLANNLKTSFGFNNEQVKNLLNNLNVNENIRGEALSPEQFVMLSNLINETNI